MPRFLRIVFEIEFLSKIRIFYLIHVLADNLRSKFYIRRAIENISEHPDRSIFLLNLGIFISFISRNYPPDI